MNAQLLENPSAQAFQIAAAVCILALAGLLSIFVSPLMVFVPFVGGALLWLVLKFPMTLLGLVVAFMPVDFMAIALGKFFGLPHMTLVSVFDKEALLLLLAFLLWRRNGFKMAAPDWFLLAFFALALIRTFFGGTLLNLAADLGFILPYAVGRVAVLTAQQEHLWARCAVWIVGILSVLGLAEVFIFGEGPRTLLYLAIDSETEGGQLTTPFHGAGLLGLREAATMVGPNGFGALCMIALVLWWVYSKNPLPAALAAVGLICSVTRNAWLGTAVAIPLLAVIMQQRKRLVPYAALALGLFVISIPVLGFTDYLFFTRTGQDPSSEYHQNEILVGLKYDVEHPFGSSNKLSPLASKEVSNALIFETTYPALAAEYGIPVVLPFVGFLFSALYLLWKEKTNPGYAALGILVSICMVMIFTNPLVDRRLMVWVWFPIGLAVRSAIIRNIPSVRRLGTQSA
jgi:hypothetical protein